MRGLRNVVKRKNLFRHFKENKYDIVCIQESYVTKGVSELWKKEWGGDMIFFESTSHSKGQIILIRKQFPFAWNTFILNERVIAVRLSIENREVCVFNIYAPNATREVKEFLHDLASKVNECDCERKIVCGDFNAVLSNELDIISGDKHQEGLVKAFNVFVNDCVLNDMWRICNPQEKEHTWSKGGGKFIARRLDYMLINDNVLDEAIECNIYSVPSSDHRGVYLQIKCDEVRRGPGYWKFNNSLLKKQAYVDNINQTIDTFLSEHSSEDEVLKWELLKLEIKETTMQYSKKVAITKRTQLVELQHELNTCDLSLAKDPENKTAIRRREQLRLNLELLEKEKLQSAQIRSKVKWIEDGEKNTKYFLNLERSRANAKLMPRLELENGAIITDQFEILEAQKEYFKTLYTRTLPDNALEDNINSFLHDCEVPQLTDEDKLECEGKVTIDEASSALKLMKNGSSPGMDGLTTEFCKFFWSKLRAVIVDSFNKSFERGNLSFTQASAVITLIHKGKDLSKHNLSNWRPISLTNTDYKILAKCLANRLCPVVQNIVHEDQVGFIKGRNVSHTLRTIDDVIEHFRLREKPGLILALDFKKAFDSISKEFMLNAFKRYGFGDNFIRWAQVLFSSTRSCVGYNGWLSSDFDVSCGVRQGCPFSPLAFVIGIELLALRFRKINEIKGLAIEAGNAEELNCFRKVLKALLYADDVTMFLRDKDDIKHVLEILDEFFLISGLVINKSKSEAMWIGSHRNSNEESHGLRWVKQIKILGIYFSGVVCASLVDANWSQRIENIRQAVCNWEKRNLGLLGKICVIKSFLISQFVYAMQAICIPEDILKEINTLLFRFLWRKRDCNKKAFEKVKRSVVISGTETGGIKMIDIQIMQESFLCCWLSKLSDVNNTNKWTWIPRKYMLNFGKDLSCLNTTVGRKKFKGLEHVRSVFWGEVLQAWLKNNKRHSPTSLKMACLWNNEDIQYQNNVIYFKNWAKNGVIHVHDLLENNNVMPFINVQRLIGPSPELFLQYRVIFSALSQYLRKHTDYSHAITEVSSKLLFNDKIISKASEFRSVITDMKYSQPCSVQFWKNKFGLEVNKKVWATVKETTSESRLRELHWKIVHNIYPTSIMLCKMGIYTNNKCSWCTGEIDYIEHFFFECSAIQSIWRSVSERVAERFDIHIKIDVQTALLGFIKSPGITKDAVNYINLLIIIAKMCIGKFKYGTALNIAWMFEMELRLRGIT